MSGELNANGSGAVASNMNDNRASVAPAGTPASQAVSNNSGGVGSAKSASVKQGDAPTTSQAGIANENAPSVESTKVANYSVATKLFIVFAVMFALAALTCMTIAIIAAVGIAPINIIGGAWIVAFSVIAGLAAVIAIGSAVGARIAYNRSLNAVCAADNIQNLEAAAEEQREAIRTQEELRAQESVRAEEERKEVDKALGANDNSALSEALASTNEAYIKLEKQLLWSRQFGNNPIRYNLGKLHTPITDSDKIKITVGGSSTIVDLSRLPRAAVPVGSALCRLWTEVDGSIVLSVNHELLVDSFGKRIIDAKTGANQLVDSGVASVTVLSKAKESDTKIVYYLRDGAKFASLRAAYDNKEGRSLESLRHKFISPDRKDFHIAAKYDKSGKCNNFLKSFDKRVVAFIALCKDASRLPGAAGGIAVGENAADKAKEVNAGIESLRTSIDKLITDVQKHRNSKGEAFNKASAEFDDKLEKKQKKQKEKNKDSSPVAECLAKEHVRYIDGEVGSRKASKLDLYDTMLVELKEMRAAVDSIQSDPEQHFASKGAHEAPRKQSVAKEAPKAAVAGDAAAAPSPSLAVAESRKASPVVVAA